MSKLVSGRVKITDITILKTVAQQLRWDIAYNTHVQYYAGKGVMCDVVLYPTTETDAWGRNIGAKYSIGFRREDDGVIRCYYDNAMNGSTVMAIDQVDAVTQRVINKLNRTIAEVTVERALNKARANWRKEITQDGTVRIIVRR